jgi:hypothetical protein
MQLAWQLMHPALTPAVARLMEVMPQRMLQPRCCGWCRARPACQHTLHVTLQLGRMSVNSALCSRLDVSWYCAASPRSDVCRAVLSAAASDRMLEVLLRLLRGAATVPADTTGEQSMEVSFAACENPAASHLASAVTEAPFSCIATATSWAVGAALPAAPVSLLGCRHKSKRCWFYPELMHFSPCVTCTGCCVSPLPVPRLISPRNAGSPSSSSTPKKKSSSVTKLTQRRGGRRGMRTCIHTAYTCFNLHCHLEGWGSDTCASYSYGWMAADGQMNVLYSHKAIQNGSVTRVDQV